jgi:hypothetical protein
METASRKLPVGIQDFEDLRTNGNVYVDKTAYVYLKDCYRADGCGSEDSRYDFCF